MTLYRARWRRQCPAGYSRRKVSSLVECIYYRTPYRARWRRRYPAGHHGGGCAQRSTAGAKLRVSWSAYIIDFSKEA